MKYARAYGVVDRFRDRPLEDGSTRHSIAEECRATALELMSGVATGWDKIDLALWLTGPYAHATRYYPRGERVAPLREAHEVTAESLEHLMTHARGQLLASLEKAALDLGTLDFTDEVLERGFVDQVIDADGRAAWVPADRVRMRLRDRLRSLFVADYLNAPYTYTELFVCHRCEAVVFDDHSKQVGICGAHRLSGMVQLEGEPPMSARTANRR